MIIVEGPDGGGKSTLIKNIHEVFGIPIHPRFVNSRGPQGDHEMIYNRAKADAIRMPEQPLSVYDRHPLISEYVYGPIIRGKLPPLWQTSDAKLVRHLVSSQSLIVWCMPPLDKVRRNVEPIMRDMDGVSANIDKIYAGYQVMQNFWDGRHTTYDYTQEDHTWKLYDKIEEEIKLKNARDYHG